MRQILAILMSFAVFFFSIQAHAAPPKDVSLGVAGMTLGKISPLAKGDKAPFDGVLLDASAAAKLMVDQQESGALCQIQIDKEVETNKAKLALDLTNMRASRDAVKKELDVRMAIKNDHINFLEKQVVLNVKKSNNGKWWLIGGIAVGIAVTIGGAFLIREIRNDRPIIVNTGT